MASPETQSSDAGENQVKHEEPSKKIDDEPIFKWAKDSEAPQEVAPGHFERVTPDIPFTKETLDQYLKTSKNPLLRKQVTKLYELEQKGIDYSKIFEETYRIDDPRYKPRIQRTSGGHQIQSE